MEPLFSPAADVVFGMFADIKCDLRSRDNELMPAIRELDRSRFDADDRAHQIPRQLLRHAEECSSLHRAGAVIHKKRRAGVGFRTAKLMDSEVLVTDDDRNDGE